LRLLFIQPSQIIDGDKFYKIQKFMFPRLSLPVIAFMTPPKVDVKIGNEYYEDVPFDDPN
jgi:hypothetical protein